MRLTKRATLTSPLMFTSFSDRSVPPRTSTAALAASASACTAALAPAIAVERPASAGVAASSGAAPPPRLGTRWGELEVRGRAERILGDASAAEASPAAGAPCTPAEAPAEWRPEGAGDSARWLAVLREFGDDVHGELWCVSEGTGAGLSEWAGQICQVETEHAAAPRAHRSSTAALRWCAAARSAAAADRTVAYASACRHRSASFLHG